MKCGHPKQWFFAMPTGCPVAAVLAMTEEKEKVKYLQFTAV